MGRISKADLEASRRISEHRSHFPKTFNEFCIEWKVTDDERISLAFHLGQIREEATIRTLLSCLRKESKS